MNSTVQWVVSHRSHSLHVFGMVFETVHELLDFQISFTYIVYGSEQWKPEIKKKSCKSISRSTSIYACIIKVLGVNILKQ